MDARFRVSGFAFPFSSNGAVGAVFAVIKGLVGGCVGNARKMHEDATKQRTPRRESSAGVVVH